MYSIKTYLIFFLINFNILHLILADSKSTKGDFVRGKLGTAFFTGKVPRPILSREERFQSQKNKIESRLEQIGELPKQGTNRRTVEEKNTTTIKLLEKNAKRGISLEVDNFSGRLLGDPKVWTRCGYQDREFGSLEAIPPGTSEIALLHNYGELRSSCGVVSWQVMEHAAKPYRINNKGIRMFVTWSNLDTVGRNKCKPQKVNEFTVGFIQVDLDRQGHWDEDSDDIYNEYHRQEQLEHHTFSSTFKQGNETGPPNLSSIAESPDGQLEVLGEMGTGCLTNLKLRVLGKLGATISDSDLGLVEAVTPDQVWEQMIRQSWMDIVKSINRDQALYGIGLEPLLIDPLMQEPIYVNTSSLGYEIEFWMWNISIAGLSNIKLDKLELVRGDSLKNVNTRATLNIGNITVNGMYNLKAVYTGWMWGMSDVDSGGEQPFAVNMTGAIFKVEIGMDTVNGCNNTENIIIKSINLPIEYNTVNFEFTNIGSVLGGVVSIIGEMAIEFSKGMIVDVVKNTVRGEVDTLLCERKYKPTEIARRTMEVDQTADSAWYSVLEEGSRGWGVHTLRRDILAEKFITKIFKDGVAKHLSNPEDPIVKLLDPFQLLPASEDFRQPGLVKGHVVVCQLYLYDLSKIKLTDMQLARNEDLTYSALKVSLSLPTTKIHGTYRLNNVKVMSVIPAPTSHGNLTISLTGVTVDLTVVLRAKPVLNEGNATIAIERFEVAFGHDTVQFQINGLAKGLNTVSNALTNALGSRILNLQRELLNKEIKNIIYGFAECMMYKAGQSLNDCMDRFWESLGFKVPFEFPSCQELFDVADGITPANATVNN